MRRAVLVAGLTVAAVAVAYGNRAGVSAINLDDPAIQYNTRTPHDSQGRSLRQFDLERRLMKYPCSYMIYSSAFDALPDDLKDATYARMWRILSGEERGKRYAGLTPEDRRAVVEILRETKRRLPEYFHAVTR